MKKFSLLISLWLVLFTASAQDYTKITTAGGVSIAEAFLVKDIISVKEHGFLVFQTYTLEGIPELEFQVYDLTRTLTHRKTFQFDATKGEPFVHGYTEWHNHFLLFVSYFNENTNTNELFLYQYTLPDLELKLSVKVMEAYSPIDLNIPFFFSKSSDESKLALTSWSYSIPKDPANVEVKVFNSDLKIIKEYKHLMPFNNLNLHINECLVDNEGTAYVCGKKHNGNTTLGYSALGSLPGDPFVLAFFNDLKEPNLYEIKVKKYRFPALEFSINPKQELVGLGYYKLGSRKTITGISSVTIGKEEKSLQLNVSEIDKDLYTAALGTNPPVIKNPSNFRYASIKDLVLKDKAYYLIGEHIRIDVERGMPTYYPSMNFYGYSDNAPVYRHSSIDFSLLDMFVIKLDTRGKIIWMKRIPKQQNMTGKEMGYSSFSVLERDRDLLLFYNDHPDNLTFKPKEKLKETQLRTAQPMLAKVHCSSGKISKRKLTSLFGKNTVIRPAFCKMIDEEKVFLYGQKKKWDLKTYRMKVARLGGSSD